MATNNQLSLSEIEYTELLKTAIVQINTGRNNLAIQVNATANSTYWNLGKLLHDRKIEGGYGSNVINRLSDDLKAEFPEMGLSPRNLWYMKRFYERFFSTDIKLQRSVAVLSWRKIVLLIEKKLSDNEVLYYATESVKCNWTRDLLLNAIKMDMFSSHKNELRDNNFAETLPAIQAEYANEIFKDSYNLGFLGITKPVKELELEKRIVEKIKRFLLELGKGFTFVGEQYTVEYAGKESRVDLLLYHRKMRCLVAIDLKIGEFIPEYAGKMNYYLSVLDRVERNEDENHSIGIILCAEKDKVQVELALEDYGKPIGVADYQLIIPKKELSDIVQSEIAAFSALNE
jgi:predicted nuclease of restriction endonuclease-like (RecB) superfamily